MVKKNKNKICYPINWDGLIEDCAGSDKIIRCTLNAEDSSEYFDSGSSYIEGEPFTAWSDKYVYFPIVSNGIEAVGRTLRSPCNIATEHLGNFKPNEAHRVSP